MCDEGVRDGSEEVVTGCESGRAAMGQEVSEDCSRKDEKVENAIVVMVE